MTANAEQIRETVDEVLARPEYDLADRQSLALDFGWFWALIEWLLTPFFRLIDSIGGLPSGFQYVIIALLVLVLIGLIAHIAYTVVGAFRKDEFTVAGFEQTKPFTIDDLVAEAQRKADAGDFVAASRALYRAALLALEEKRDGYLRKGLTNTEYLRTFKAPWVVDNLRVFVDLINWKWYRDNRFEKEDYEACRAAYDAIQKRLREEFS